MKPEQYKSQDEIAWCPGCGNFAIRNALMTALSDLDLQPKNVLLVSGIGQAAKTPHYVNANCFNGLHGRALPAAVAAKVANKDLTIIVHTGDGDCYGEGGNHFVHNIRRNTDLTVIVHNNQVYGLTKGQASPTSDPGFITKVQSHGVMLEPFHALALAISLGAGFVARSFAKNLDQLSSLIKQGIEYKGFALIETLQPCVSFNKKNTYKWYSERVYDVQQENGFDPSDKASALNKAFEWGQRIPTGIIYRTEKDTFEQKLGLLNRPPLVDDDISNIDISQVLEDFM